jgi:hypothetical protein
VQSGHQRLVVGENVEDSALQEEPEVPEGLEDGEQLPVEGGVAGLRGRQLPGEERQRAPTASTPLLESSSNVGGGGVDRQRDLRGGGRMNQRGGGGQGGLGSLEGQHHLLRPEQRLGLASERVREGAEDARHTRDEPTVDYQTEEPLKLWDVLRLRKVEQGIHVTTQRDEASRRRKMSQKLHRVNSKNTLGRVDDQPVLI